MVPATILLKLGRDPLIRAYGHAGGKIPFPGPRGQGRKRALNTERRRFAEQRAGQRLDGMLHFRLGLGIQRGQFHRHAHLGMIVEHFAEPYHGGMGERIVGNALQF